LSLIVFFICWRRDGAFFYFLAAYLPFQIALNPAAGVDLASGRILILVLFAAVLLKNGWQSVRSGGKTGIFLSLFLVLCLISLLGANDYWRGIRKVLFLASIFPLMPLVVWFINDAKKAKKFLDIILFSSLACAVLGLIQFISQFFMGIEKASRFLSLYIAPVFYGHSFGRLVVENPSWYAEVRGETIMRAVGVFPDPHMFSFFLGFGALFALSVVIFYPKRKIFSFFVFIVCSLTLFLTFSRGGYLGFLAGVCALIVVSWPKLSVKAKKLFRVSLLAATVCVFIWGGPVASRFISSFDSNEGSNAGRLEIWREVVYLSRDSFWTGAGLGNYPLLLNPYENYRSAVTSHNLYLDILVETGVFGLIAWIVFLFYCFKNSLRQIRSEEAIARVFGAGCFGFFVYFSVHSFFETAIFNPTILAFLMIAAGLSASLNHNSPLSSLRRGLGL
ncbi:MAG: Heptosyltransferase family, partial [Parcubacteria group bacterium GW2011_GWA1_42_7]